MKYLESAEERQALTAMPLEQLLRGVSVDRVIDRLRSERALANGGLTRPNGATSTLLVVILAERVPDQPLAESIASVALQSHPDVRCVLVAADIRHAGAIEGFLRDVKIRPGSLEFWKTLDGENRARLQKADYVTFLRHGDRLHPSAAAWLAIEGPNGGDVVSWGELQSDANGGTAWMQRNPNLHLVSLMHAPFLRNAFAVRTRWPAAYPGDLLRETLNNELHLFQIWLTRRESLRWASHPEFFLLRAAARASEKPEQAARRAFADYADAYAALFGNLSGEYAFTVQAHDAPAPYRLRPRHLPRTLSVIIPFRDKPNLTLRAVQSIEDQAFPGFIEIILVNNQSSAESVSAIEKGLAKLGALTRCRIIDYDKPFNHSAQCSLGVRESVGEIIVFLNNDAEILTPHALEDLAAWANAPGVATAGAAMQDPVSGKVSAGMEARLGPSPYFDSIVEEFSAPALTPFVRETFGNTFALTALSRVTFDTLGGLDALRFPNGFNDVDFACRARAKGLKHITLGHVVARHSPGQSRGRSDESAQKILLRLLYPNQSVAALSDLRFDPPLAAPKQASSPTPPPPVKQPLARVQQIEQRRPFLKRAAGRLSQTRFAQRLLTNPTTFRVIRRVYKLVIR
jgi:GT2 family glycosyltransferase